MGKQGVTHPAYFEHDDKGWLRNFFVGTLSTCGLTNAGLPSGEHGLHGRIGNIPAKSVNAWSRWEEERYITHVEGDIREAVIFGENLGITRTYDTQLGSKSFTLQDCIENRGGEPAPMMIIYHMNFGYPLLSPHTRLLLPPHITTPRDDEARKGEAIYETFGEPVPGYAEQVYFHNNKTDAQSVTGAGLWNEALGLGIGLTWNKSALPYMTQWKNIGVQDYVCGLEPGNCLPEGQNAARAGGRLQVLQPGEQVHVSITLTVLDGVEDYRQFSQWLAGLSQ